jgi:hypothetical protein
MQPTRSAPGGRRVAKWFVLALALPLVQGLRPSAALAQQAAVQGIVIDQATTQPLLGATVVLEQRGQQVRSVQTDRSGLFQVAGLAGGAYRFRIILFGYVTHEETIELEGGERLVANRALAPDPLQLEGVRVVQEGPGAVRRDLGGQTITASDLARIPTPAASGDLASYLQTMPGVVGAGDRGGQLFIRGGTPSENLVLMDGMLVYQPFHVTGFFSVFPEDLIDRAEFFPGGFGPKYTDRISSVLDVQMRDGSRNERAVRASVSPFLADVVVEGPVHRKGGLTSYIVSARRSLIEETSPWLLGEKQPLGFSSYYMKLSSLSRDGGSRCSLTGMRSSDRGGLDPKDAVSRVGWANTLVGGRCTALAGDVFVDARVAFSRVANEAITRGASEFTSAANLFSMNGDLSRTVGRVRLNMGAFTRVEAVDFDFLEFQSYNQGDSGSEGGGVYGEADLPLGGGIRLLPGATVSWFPGVFSPSIEPRLRASWHPGGAADAELSGALGLYEQRIAGISDRRDASSIFTAWMGPPDDAKLQSMHAQASWQQTLGSGISYSIDGYYRRMRHLPVSTWSTVAAFTPELSLAEGRAHGADGRIEYRRGPFYGFGAYGYSWTEYRSAQDDFGVWFGEPVQTFHPPHDRRHQANALASLQLGHYTFAARWEFGSGFPFTRPLGFNELLDFGADLPNVRGIYGETRVLLDRPYSAQLPAIHRLDLSMERVVDLGSRELQLQAGVINAYDRRNIFYYDVFTARRIDQLPIAPYLSVKIQPRSGTPR